MSYRNAEIVKDIAISEEEILKQIKDLTISSNRGKRLIELDTLYCEVHTKTSPTKMSKVLFAIQRIVGDEINSILLGHPSGFYVRATLRPENINLYVFRKRQWWFDQKVAKLQISLEEGKWIVGCDPFPEMKSIEKHTHLHAIFPAFCYSVLKNKLDAYSIEVRIDATLKAIEEEPA